jgi:acyl carrier protein
MNAIESRITEICQGALGRTEIRADESLVDAGADSLVAVEIVTQIEIDYGVDLVELFFESPTINSLAAAVEKSQQGSVA